MRPRFDTDNDLLNGLAKGDSRAIAEFYARFYKMWSGWAIGRGCSESDVDDVFQETLVIIYQKSQEGEIQLTCQLSTYLLAIAKRVWYRQLQSNNRFDFRDEWPSGETTWEEPDRAIEEHRTREIEYERLEEALNLLGDPCKSLLKSFYEDKKSMQELAELFNYTNADNAKTQKYKCLVRLRKLFFKQRSDDKQAITKLI